MKKIATLLLAALFVLPCLPEANLAMGAPGVFATVRASASEPAALLKRKKNKKKRRLQASAYQRGRNGKIHFHR